MADDNKGRVLRKLVLLPNVESVRFSGFCPCFIDMQLTDGTTLLSSETWEEDTCRKMAKNIIRTL